MERFPTEKVREAGGLSPAATAVDEAFARRALSLAWQGAGHTRTNPMVGAVVVRDGRIVGEGYHEVYGQAHAESRALDAAGDRAVGATLYVSLEPCTHHGNTPPCTDRVISSGVKRVVVCTLDPDPRMNGRGIRQLQDAGIEVEVGCLAEIAVSLNLPYLKKHLGMGPAVTLKMAVTLDGRIASREGVRDAVTGEDTQLYVHRLRATRDAVLIGINTLLVDAPLLDARRLRDAAMPVPAVLDSGLRLPPDCRWLLDGRLPMVLRSRGAAESPGKREALEAAGARVIDCAGTESAVDPAAAVAALENGGMSSVLVEGGAAVFSSFLASDTWDDVHVFVAPRTFGADGVGAVRERMDALPVVLVGTERVGDDVHFTYLRQECARRIVDRLS